MALQQYNAMIREKKYLFLFSLLLLFFLGLHVFFLFMRHHDIHWDEAVYISMGKYLYSLGTEGLFESIRPLGLPLVLGLFWKLGLGTVFVYQTVIFLFSLGVLFLVYLLGKELFSEESAFFACLALVLSPLFFQSSVSIMTEIPATFFILLSIYLLVRGKHTFFVGIMASFAFLFKFPAGLLVPALLFVSVLEYVGHWKKLFFQCASFMFGVFLIQLPFFIFNYFMYRAHSATVFDAVFRPLLLAEGHASNAVHAVSAVWQNIFYYMFEIIQNNPLLLLGFLGCISLFFSKSDKNKQLVLFVPLFVFFIYFTSIVNKQLRFAVLFLPLLALFAGHLLQQLLALVSQGKIVRKLLFCLIIFYPLFTFSLLPTFTLAYRFYPEEVLLIEQDYYSYFSQHSFQGDILTTEPYFSAYTDGILAYPYYNNLTDALEIYEKYKDDASYVVFTSDFYPCTDSACFEQISLLHEEIAATHTLVYSKEWNGVEREIFVK
ncbi:glycosyltransferase family 39 protein [Candidatus Woesearchaeota archaeon]|nr:glycosyltransferase family 39 protein [Candidatus Woesearchaeota archaeon]